MKRAAICWILVLLLGSAITNACVLPVFRYALERWEPSPYLATIYYSDSMSSRQQELLTQLASNGANLIIRTCSFDSLTAQDSTILDSLGSPMEPTLVITAPPTRTGDGFPVWTSSFSDSSTAQVIESPLRRKLAKDILDGTSTVFLVLLSGNQARDSQFLMRFKDQLKKAERMVKLPDFGNEDLPGWYDPARGPELRIHFKMETIHPSDSQEKFLITLLRNQVPELADSIGPMVFPVFGRGRCIGGFAASELSQKEIESLCSFLTGNCSCEIKEENPGFDILMKDDWEDRPYLSDPKVWEPTYTGLTAAVEIPKPASSPQTVPSQPDAQSSTNSNNPAVACSTPKHPDTSAIVTKSSQANTPIIRGLLVSVGAIIVFVIIAWFGIRMRRK